MSDNSGKMEGLKYVILIIMGALVVLGIFMILNRGKNQKQSNEEVALLTPVQEITTMDFDRSYPPSEREVVSMYCRIHKVLYAEDYSDADFAKMAALLQSLNDEELNAAQADYFGDLKADVESKKSGGYTLQNYVIADRKEVVYRKLDGREMANVKCLMTMRKGTEMGATNYLFVLRKDEQDRWKIYGWTPLMEDNIDN